MLGIDVCHHILSTEANTIGEFRFDSIDLDIFGKQENDKENLRPVAQQSVISDQREPLRDLSNDQSTNFAALLDSV